MLKSAFSFDKFARIISIVIGFFLINFILFYAQSIEAFQIPVERLKTVQGIGSIGYMLIVIIALSMTSKNND